MFLCFDFELRLTPQDGNLGLMQSMSRIWASAISGLEFGTQRPWCVFRSIVTDRFGIVTAEFGIVTDRFGDVTDGGSEPT